jgi:hypothetical protein
MSLHERIHDRRILSTRAKVSAALIARYERLVESVARTSVADPVLAQAVVGKALLALLTMPEADRTTAHVIATTRRIAHDVRERFARATAPP